MTVRDGGGGGVKRSSMGTEKDSSSCPSLKRKSKKNDRTHPNPRKKEVNKKKTEKSQQSAGSSQKSGQKTFNSDDKLEQLGTQRRVSNVWDSP